MSVVRFEFEEFFLQSKINVKWMIPNRFDRERIKGWSY